MREDPPADIMAVLQAHLSASLAIRYSQTETIEDISNALAQTPPSHPSHADNVSRMSRYIFNKYMQIGDLTELDKAITLAEQAVAASPPGRPGMHRTWGVFLAQRFTVLGMQQDQDSAILHTEAAVQGTPSGHPPRTTLIDKSSQEI